MDRATSPVVGSVVLVVITVVLAGSVAATFGSVSMPSEPAVAHIDGSVDADTNRTVLVHRRGDALDVDRLDVTMFIEGDPLAHQPDVPFNGTVGFDGAPEGPFNAASSDHVWNAGEQVAFVIASTNSETPDAGDTVTVQITRDGYPVAVIEMTAQ